MALMKVGLAFVALFAWGCGSFVCKSKDPMPGTFPVMVPDDIFVRIVSTRADTCAVTGPVRPMQVLVQTTTNQPCHVFLTLDDGSVFESTVDFRRFDTTCGTGVALVDASTFETSDGGATD